MPLSGPTAYRPLGDLGQPAIGNTAKFVMLLAGAAQGTASRLHMSMALACSCWFNCGDVLRVTVKNFKNNFNRSVFRFP